MERSDPSSGKLRLRICWIFGAIWTVSLVFSLVLPNSGLATVAGGLQVLMIASILCVHASLLYGWRGTIVYLSLGTAVGFALEASSVANGFPFGSYVHHAPGPKPLGVPIPAILAYVTLGWYAWAVARVITLARPDRLNGGARFTLPIVAGLVIAGFDYPYDPIGATVQKAWSFAYPSGQFGVPLSNFLGWIFTGWVLFQILALIEHRFPPRGSWRLAAIGCFHASCGCCSPSNTPSCGCARPTA